MIAIFGPVTTSSSPCSRYLGFVSSAAVQELDQSLKYIAIEDYHTEDPRQICFKKGTPLIVVETSEDGKILTDQ